MAMFDRDKSELMKLLYKVGDKIMGHHSGVGVDMLVGGTVIEVSQSRSYLSDNSYKVQLEPEICTKGHEGIWWINEKEAMPFKQDSWNRAAKHWNEHLNMKEKSYLEYVKMFRALREENDDIDDEELMKEINR